MSRCFFSPKKELQGTFLPLFYNTDRKIVLGEKMFLKFLRSLLSKVVL